jgi:Fic family protein
MSEDLTKLLDAARRVPFSEAQREQQRRSFAYGNARIENPRITRQTVDEQAEKLKSLKS